MFKYFLVLYQKSIWLTRNKTAKTKKKVMGVKAFSPYRFLNIAIAAGASATDHGRLYIPKSEAIFNQMPTTNRCS
jgi:hypothetical protein